MYLEMDSVIVLGWGNLHSCTLNNMLTSDEMIYKGCYLTLYIFIVARSMCCSIVDASKF